MGVKQPGRRFETVARVGGDRAGTGVHGDPFEPEFLSPIQDRVNEPTAQSAVTFARNDIHALQIT